MKKQAVVRSDGKLVGIGEASQQSQLSIQQIRYLEAIGLVQPTRMKMGEREDRLFTTEQVAFLHGVKAQMDLHKCPISAAVSFIVEKRRENK